MSWAEVKTINSNPSLPLNKVMGQKMIITEESNNVSKFESGADKALFYSLYSGKIDIEDETIIFNFKDSAGNTISNSSVLLYRLIYIDNNFYMIYVTTTEVFLLNLKTNIVKKVNSASFKYAFNYKPYTNSSKETFNLNIYKLTGDSFALGIKRDYHCEDTGGTGYDYSNILGSVIRIKNDNIEIFELNMDSKYSFTASNYGYGSRPAAVSFTLVGRYLELITKLYSGYKSDTSTSFTTHSKRIIFDLESFTVVNTNDTNTSACSGSYISVGSSSVFLYKDGYIFSVKAGTQAIIEKYTGTASEDYSTITGELLETITVKNTPDDLMSDQLSGWIIGENFIFFPIQIRTSTEYSNTVYLIKDLASGFPEYVPLSSDVDKTTTYEYFVNSFASLLGMNTKTDISTSEMFVSDVEGYSLYKDISLTLGSESNRLYVSKHSFTDLEDLISYVGKLVKYYEIKVPVTKDMKLIFDKSEINDFTGDCEETEYGLRSRMDGILRLYKISQEEVALGIAY